MKILVTGGAGFVGSHLVDKLMRKGNVVTIYDNLSSGKKEFIKEHLRKDFFKFIKADLLNFKRLKSAMRGQEVVFHLAANPDIRDSLKSPDTDLKQGTLATFNVLEAMRLEKVKKIVFSSSSVIYGEAKTLPTPEDYGPLIPISLYGASKLSCEGLITAYAHTFGINAWIIRFANIVGKRTTHGILFDFLKKLKRNPQKPVCPAPDCCQAGDAGGQPARLEILGNGKQRKSYLLIEECIEGILFAFKNSCEKVNIFNLGCQDNMEVSRIAEIFVEEMGFGEVKFAYTGEKRGWPGDVPQMMLDVKKINKLGWKARYTSEEAIRQAIQSLKKG